MYNLNISASEYKDRIEQIRRERKQRLVVVMLTVFGDESADEKEQRVFAVSGIIGTQEEWDTLEIVWSDRTKGIPFHAAECEANRGPYKGNTHQENLRLYADLIKILVRTNMVGYAVVDDLKAHRKFFHNTPKFSPYHVGFQKVIIEFAKIGYLSIPQHKVKFTFDINSKTEASCGVLYDCLKKSRRWKLAEYITDEISFADRRSNIGIQAADLIAREAMKHADSVLMGSKGRRIRTSMYELCSSNKYNFELLDEDYFQECKSKLQGVQEEIGFNRNDYELWLTEKRLNDNLTNRYRYLLEIGGN